jgi:beta-lactamase class A
MRISELLAAVDGAGEFGVWLGRTDGRAVFGHRADDLHYSASTMKLPVAIAAMRMVDAGTLDLEQQVNVHNGFVSAAEGRTFGVRRDQDDAQQTWEHLGGQVTLGWLMTEMISRSSNLATDLVLELTGVPAADEVLREFRFGQSAIRRGIDDRPGQAAGISNLMSPADLAGVLIAVSNDKAASPESCGHLRDLLAANEWNGELPAGLPAGTRVEHKNGWDDRIRHDGGVIRPPDAEPFVLSVFTTSELPDPDAQRLIADIAAEAWAHRHDLAAVS